MKISILIPNWNGVEKIKANLPKVLKVRGVDEVIICDDGSTDESVEVIKENFPKVRLIESEKNYGFSTNVNKGFKTVSNELIFLLNSDAVPEADCLEKIIDLFKDEMVFSVGFNTGGTWSWGFFKDGFFWHGQAKEVPKGIHETLWVSGGSGVFRKSIWDELKGLDELMDPFYWEDVDIGYRARKRGYINLWNPQARVEHYKQKGVIEENFSKSYINKISGRNQLIFIWKNITDANLIWLHIWALFMMLVTHPKYLTIFLPAFINLPKILTKRQIERKAAKLKDCEILEKFKL